VESLVLGSHMSNDILLNLRKLILREDQRTGGSLRYRSVVIGVDLFVNVVQRNELGVGVCCLVGWLENWRLLCRGWGGIMMFMPVLTDVDNVFTKGVRLFVDPVNRLIVV